ncbi:S1 RNA-binding domain-containing protein, partial [bacterium]|nr:S1 RNA-binding domain-containing protein [bacterium]
MAEDQQKDAPENEEVVSSPEAAATETPTEAPVKAEAETTEAPEAVVEESAPAEASPAEPETEETPPVEAAPVEASAPVVEEEAAEVSTDSTEEVVMADSDEKEDDSDDDEETVEFEKQLPSPPRAGMLGFTGEITGQVYSLADLDKVVDPEDWNVGLDDLRKLVENTLTNVSEHEIVTGKVVSVGEKDVVIDIGFKSDGIVSRSEFGPELEAGQDAEVYLERIEDYHGQLVLSKTKADTVRRWRRIEDAFNNEEVLEGLIVRRIKGGMIVELLDGMEAFLPGSQIDVRPVRDFDAYLEKRMEFKIVKLNPTNENIVVSHKALIEKDLMAQREKILLTMEPGQILEGIVKNITDFGVFIDLGGVDGLLHIT